MAEVRRDTGLLSDALGGIGDIGRKMTLTLTAPLLALGGGAVKAASDFEAAMRNINSIASLTDTQFQALSEQVLQFGSSIRSGPQAAAESLYEVFSAGITEPVAAMELMKNSVATAEAGLADLDVTTRALTATLLAYGVENINAAQASDVWTRMVQLGVGSMQDFVSGMKNVVPTASIMGVKFEELGAAWSFITQRGIDAGSSATFLNQAMTNLLKPSEAMKAIFDKLGGKTIGELMEKYGSLGEVIYAVGDAVDFEESALAKAFSNIRGFKAIAPILQDFDVFKDYLEEFNSGLDGSTGAARQEQLKSFAAQWDLTKSALTGAAITIGNQLMPVITPLLDGVRNLATNFAALPPEVIAVAVAFAGAVAAAGPLLWILGSLLTPFGLIVGGVTALGVAVATNFGGIRDSITNAIETVLGPLDGLRGAIEEFFSILTEPASDPFGSVTAGSVDLGNTLSFTVKEGDWPQKIADELGVSVQDILDATGAANVYSLPIGEFKIELPGSAGGAGNAPSLDAFLPGDQVADNSLGGRLARAFEAAWPKIETALNTMWANVQTWFTGTFLPGLDAEGSRILDSITAGINTDNTYGENGVTNAIQSFLAFDPGSIFEGSQFAASFSGLVDRVGEWIANVGVPTLANTLGMIAAKIPIELARIITSIFSGGQQAELTPDQMLDDLFTGAIPEAEPPFLQTLAQNFLDSFVTGFTDVFSTADFSSVGEGLLALLTTGLLGVFTLSRLIGVLQSLGIGSTLATAFRTVVTTGQGLANIGTSVGTALVGALGRGGIVDTIRLQGMYLFSGIATTITGGITAAIATVGGWATAAGAAIMGGIGSAVALAGTAITAATGWIAATAGTIGTALAVAVPLAIAAAPFVLIAAGVVAGLALVFSEDARQGLRTAFGSFINSVFGDNTWEDFNREVEDVGYAIAGGIADALGQPDIGDAIRGNIQGGNFAQELGETIISKDESLVISPKDISISSDTPINIGSFMTAFNNAFANMTTATLTPDTHGASLDAGDLIAPPTEEKVTAIAQATVDPLTNTMATLLAEAGAAGNLDSTAIVDTMVTPIANAFIMAFGEEGTARLAWVGFADTFTINMDKIQTNMNLAMTKLTVFKTAFLTSFDSIMKGVLEAASVIAKEIAGIATSLEGAANAAGITGGTGGGGETLTGRASGGSLQGWGLVGERGPEPVYFGAKGQVIPTRILKSALAGGTGGGTSIENINISGVQDVDGLLYELKRRGIMLNG